MSVARIVTRVKQDADELAKDLRSRGFDVEVVTPDEACTRSADLEISLEECSTEQALRSVETVPVQEDVCVFIAPGALVESNRPMIVVPLYLENEAPPYPAPAPIRSAPAAFQVEEPRLPTPLATPVAIHSEMGNAILLADDSDLAPEAAGELPQVVDAIPFDPPVTIDARGPAEKFSYRTVFRLQIAQGDKLFGKVAFAVAIMSVFGLLLTVSARRISPLPPALEQATTQVAQPAPARKPALGTKVVTYEREVAGKPPSLVGQPVSAAGDRELIAKDTVVRYNKKPVAPPAPPPQPAKKPGIKYYTDLK